MAKVRIKVMKKVLHQDLIDDYLASSAKENGFGLCTAFEEGQEFILEGMSYPEGFCHWAWADIQRDVMMVMFGFGAGTHSDQAVGVASKSFSSGLSGIWYQWLWLPCTPFYWLIAPVMRRFRAITTGDVFEARYDRSVAVLYACIGMLNLSVNIGLML